MDSAAPQSKAALWTGRVISALIVIPMLLGIVFSLKGGPQIAEGFAHLGIPMSMLTTLIVLESLSVILYAIPATSMIGAILLTGYMGGAICTHLRIGEKPYIQALIAILAWLGLYLRDNRLHALMPIRRCERHD